MSDRQLPDDLAAWPTNPYELLDVPDDVSLRDARRAYLQLIRVYKPEVAPAQFQRIRAAYEAIQSHIEFREQFAAYSLAPVEPAKELPPTSPPESAHEVDRSADEPPPSRRPKPDLDPWREAWSLAERGDETGAADRLQALFAVNPSEASVRLYWLRKANGNTVVACEWLARGLRESPHDSRLRELLRREIERSTEAALSDTVTGLLDVASADLVLCVAEWRWQSCSQLHDETVLVDWRRLRERFPRDNDVRWAQLLFLVIDQLIWSSEAVARQTVRECRAEVESFHHLHGPLDYAFDRLDFLTVLVDQYQQGRASKFVHARWWELLRISWTQSAPVVRAFTLRLLADIATDVEAVVAASNVLASGSAAAMQLESVFSQHFHREFGGRLTARDADECREAASRFLRQYWDERNPFRQADFVQFCWYEAIAPHDLLRHYDEDNLSDRLDVLKLLIADSPALQLAYVALRAYWG